MDREVLKQRILGEPEDFRSYLIDLLKAERIENTVALGISKRIIDQGPEGLSDKQWYTFLEQGLMNENYVEYCELCASTIPWSEMIGAVYIFEDDYCSYCRHITEKMERS